MFPEWTWIVGLMIGASIGSFLNVVIYRMPRGMSLGDPKHSFCPLCNTQLRLPDLIPLFSWLIQRGKCRHCGAPIPARYFFVELLTGALFALVWWQQLIAGQDPAAAFALSFFMAALVAVIYIDAKHFIIPDQVNAAILIIGLLYNVGLILIGDPRAYTWGMPSSIAGALVGWGALWSITLLGRLFLGKDAMGHGDIKLTRGMGAVLFPAGVGIAMALSVVVALIGSILLVLPRLWRKKGDETPATEDEEAEEDYEPESIGSIFKCGLGYLLAFDVIGLFVPKFYEKWFGENPFATEEVEDSEDWVGETTIPFGPYLAIGAILVVLFQPTFVGWIMTYWENATGLP